MADPYDLPVALPLGSGSVSTTERTADMLLNPVTVIAPIVRDLVARNRGYFIEDVFSTPGFTVEGGAILATINDAGDPYLEAGNGIAPRAPLAETPLVTGLRKAPVLFKVESWTGAFEVADESVRRNNIPEVTMMQTKVANSLALKMQQRGMAVLTQFVTDFGRSVAAAHGWRGALTNGAVNVDPAKTILDTLAVVEQQFTVDESGMAPDMVILHPADLRYARLTLPGTKLRETLADFGIDTVQSSVRQTPGTATFLKKGAVGYIAFETPLNTEIERLTEGRRGNRYNMEATPVFVANDTTAVLNVTGIDSAS